MMIFFLILILIACVALGFIILVQNPKGGGLSGSVAGFSTQFMGVKQTTDVLEKGTWLFAGVVAVLCLFSSLIIWNVKSASGIDRKISAPTQTQQSNVPATPVAPAPTTTTVPTQNNSPVPQKSDSKSH